MFTNITSHIFIYSDLYIILYVLSVCSAAAFRQLPAEAPTFVWLLRLALSVADEGLESEGVLGPAECGVLGGWPIFFWRTSRIFSCRSCLRGNTSMCLVCKRCKALELQLQMIFHWLRTWKAMVA